MPADGVFPQLTFGASLVKGWVYGLPGIDGILWNGQFFVPVKFKRFSRWFVSWGRIGLEGWFLRNHYSGSRPVNYYCPSNYFVNILQSFLNLYMVCIWGIIIARFNAMGLRFLPKYNILMWYIPAREFDIEGNLNKGETSHSWRITSSMKRYYLGI